MLVQSQRFDCPFVNCSGNRQAVIALEVRQARPRVNAQRTRNFSIIIACILQSGLDIGDYLIWEQITVSVDRPIVVVIALQWIIAPCRIPIASVQEIISGGNENDGVTMVVPPVSVVPLVPVTTERLVKADIVVLVMRFFGVRLFLRFVHLGLICRRWIVSRNIRL